VVALFADALLGEPPLCVHPVAMFGKFMGAVERWVYRDSRIAGAAYTAVGVTSGALAGAALPGPVATYIAVAARNLWAEARGVGDALGQGDIDDARRRLPALVGRDPTMLDSGEIARAAVESVAENTVDAIVAPVLWGRAGLALPYRAINTMDAMVGHHSARYERFGWASARLDDIANWVPARVTAALIAAVRPGRALDVLRAVRDQAPTHPSPNAGVAEAAFAAALGVRLGGENRYGDRVEVRAPLGTGRAPNAADIGRAVRLSQRVTLALAGLA
jgi:adenosylcobinamide-phosphate synthase